MTDNNDEILEKEDDKELSTPRDSFDVFEAFDEMWNDFRKGFITTRRPSPRSLTPWWRRELMNRRTACSDLIDEGTHYKICAEIPGIPKEMIDIDVSKNEIEISAKAEKNRKEEDKGYLLNERSYSEIHRKITFPEETVPENAEARLENGLLEVIIPKKVPTTETKSHKVKIS
jgi:HSP20 family protein